MRVLAAALLAGASLVAAGCGSSGSGAGTAAPAASTALETASLAPKDAGAWVEVDLDRSSAQWQALEAFLGRIPGGQKALDDLLSQSGAKVDFDADVRPAVGPRLVLVVPNGAEQPVVLVRPDDRAKLDALLAKTKEQEVTGEVQGWTAVATSQQALDAYESALAKGSLADAEAFAKTTADLPQEGLARGYVNGSGLGKALGSAGGALAGASGLGGAVPGVTPGSLGTAAFSVSAADGALRVDGSTYGAPAAASYRPSLLRRVPADALVALSFHGGADVARQLGDAAGAGAVKQLEQQLGVSLDDLGAALDGEAALYVRAGAPIPEITLAVEPSDPTAAERALEAVVARVAATGAGTGGALPLPIPTFAVRRSGGTVVVSTSTTALAALDSSQPKLASTARFERAAKDVGLGDRTAGFAYVDVRALGPLLRSVLSGLGATGGSGGSQGLDALAALDTVALGASTDGGRTRFSMVVRAG
jgi:hypothetical protein